jgi:DNA-binding NtrC family response regulator
MNILIVTDDATYRNSVREVLTVGGMNLMAARDARDALKYLKENPVEAIVVEQGMPFFDPVRFCVSAREALNKPGLHCVFLVKGDGTDHTSKLTLPHSSHIYKSQGAHELLSLLRDVETHKEQPPPPASKSKTPPPQAKPDPGQEYLKAKLLIVDDDQNFRLILRATLEDEGYQKIAMAEDGNEAITMVKKEKFDVVLCDIFMPNISGFEVLKFIREQPHPAPVIMVTAYKDLKLAIEAKKLGAFDFVAKPFIRADLMETIQRALTVS